MLGRRQRSAVSQSPVVEAGSAAVGKTAETVSELASRAVVAAREAQRVATPALRSAAHTSAETLSHAAEKAAEVLSEAADRLAREGAEGVAAAATGVASAASGVAQTVGPKPKRWGRRVRRLLLIGGVAGAAYAVVTKTPVGGKLSELVFGPPLDEEEPEPITLPVTGSPVEGQSSHSPAQPDSAAAESTEGARAEEVASGSASQDDGTGQ